MAFVLLYDGDSGDLFSVTYNYGNQADVVRVMENATAASYVIKTYGNSDTISTLRVTSTTFPTYVYAGSGQDEFYGGSGRDFVHDGSGDDFVLLGDGNDAIFAGAGTDFYDGQGGNDSISYLYGTNDTGAASTLNASAVSVDLLLLGPQFINATYGTDTLRNIENLSGSNGADFLGGTNGVNTIYGFNGADTLSGRGGVDFLFGGFGSDDLIGGTGADALYCSSVDSATYDVASRDYIVYTSVSDSGLTDATADIIYRFDNTGPDALTDDVIDLTALSLTPFLFRGTYAGTSTATAFGTNAAAEVKVKDIGTDFRVYVDTDSDTAAEFTIIVNNVAALDAGDFLL